MVDIFHNNFGENQTMGYKLELIFVTDFVKLGQMVYSISVKSFKERT